MAVLSNLERFKVVAMDDPTKYGAFVGGAVAALFIAMREGYQRFKGSDPLLKKMQEDMALIKEGFAALQEGQRVMVKVQSAHTTQIDALSEYHHDLEGRVVMVERNGNGKK